MSGLAQLPEEETENPFAYRLRAFRTGRKLAQDELASAVGATPAAVRRWESGTAWPSKDQAARLVGLGMHDISEADNNARSIPRLHRSARALVLDGPERRRRVPRWTFTFAGESFDVVPAPYVLNGPVDQEAFHKMLLQLQMEPASPPSIPVERYKERLSLVSEVDGTSTSQARLEHARAVAVSWNSNFGSHGWHRYVGRFPPHLVRALLNHFQAGPDDIVLDPFTGSGTTNVECRLIGVPSIGVEISPLSALIARTKSNFPDSADAIVKLATSLTEFYVRRWSSLCLDDPGLVPSHRAILRRPGNPIRPFPNCEKWLTPKALLGISIVAEYAAGLEPTAQDLLLLALSARMRSIGNVDVDVVRAEYRKEPRANVDVLRLVCAQLRKMAKSVEAMHDSHAELASATETKIVEGSILEQNFAEHSIAHVITSPPYGVESLSYLRTHLLSFRCLEPFLEADPYQTGAGVIGSEYLDRPESLEARYTSAAASPTFNAFFRGVPTGNDRKNHQRTLMMMRFFDDMGLLIGKLSRWVRPGGNVAFVIGNKRLGDAVIPANQIISELFELNGFALRQSIEHKLKTNNSNSQVPWQERIIRNEYVLVLCKV